MLCTEKKGRRMGCGLKSDSHFVMNCVLWFSSLKAYFTRLQFFSFSFDVLMIMSFRSK